MRGTKLSVCTERPVGYFALDHLQYHFKFAIETNKRHIVNLNYTNLGTIPG